MTLEQAITRLAKTVPLHQQEKGGINCKIVAWKMDPRSPVTYSVVLWDGERHFQGGSFEGAFGAFAEAYGGPFLDDIKSATPPSQ